MSFLGVYKAIYAYVPQNEQELAIEENDLLYLLEKSDVDDWWTVKKRVVGADADEPVGLVPSNYIQPADVIATATSLYDYDRQTEEEVSFKEGDQFQVYDDKDPDWILVSNGKEYGFAPANYIGIGSGGASQNAPSKSFQPPPSHPSFSTASVNVTPVPVLQPPPQRYDAQPKQQTYSDEEEYEAPAPTLPSKPRPVSTDYSRRDSYRDANDDYEAPPPKPSRPTEQRGSSSSNKNNINDEDDQLYTWAVSEVDGRKKKKAMLAIGNGNIYFSPDSVNGGSPQQWRAKDLLSFSSEKKHLFLEFKEPFYSLELHTGTTSVATEILSVLGELKGAVSQKGLKEIKEATASKPSSSSSKKTGKIMYNFEAEGADELTVHEGDVVIIVNNTKSKDWWLVQNQTTGKAGVVPAQFVEPMADVKEKSSFSSKFKLSRSKSKENIKKEADSSPSKKPTTPKSSRIRTWEDRSGTFKVDAEFLGVVEGKIHLHKTNGVKIAVEANKLSLTDLEYVERVTGMSLESFKAKHSKSSDDDRERRARKERERKRRDRDDQERDRIQYERERLERLSEREKLERERDRKERDLERREREMDKEERERLRRELADAKRKLAEMPPAKPARVDPVPQFDDVKPTRAVASGPKKDSYDWFEFFLESGVDVNQCQRYSNNFTNEQIDPSILESIDASVLRTLGLREGDIIRVTKYIDQKFNRQPAQSVEANSNGGLFTDSTGALTTNRTGSGNQVSGSLPSPTKTNAKLQPASVDDDAWTVKRAANSEPTGGSMTQQFTGSMQDLVNLKPLEPTKTSSSARSFNTLSQPMESAKTSGSMAPALTGGMTAQATGVPLDPFKTGGGNLLPLATGGFVYLPIQQTGIINLQPTGLMPLQKTGGMNGILTGGLMPLQRTAGLMPLQRTGGLMPLQRTGGLSVGLTGGLMPLQRTGGIPQTSFGVGIPGIPQTSFGGPAMPATSFGQPSLTGGLMQPMGTGFNGGFATQLQPTGGLPQTSFGGQPTGVFQPQPQPQPMFNSTATGGFPQTSFGAQPVNQFQPTAFSMQNTGFQPQQQSFGVNAAGYNSLSSPPTLNNLTNMNNLTNSFQNANIGSPFPQQQMPQQTFGQPVQQQFGQPQTTFGQGAPVGFGFGQQQQQQQSMPQPSFGGFGQTQLPLEAQPTGFGFGNTPNFGGSSSGQRADLSKASADNPFGF